MPEPHLMSRPDATSGGRGASPPQTGWRGAPTRSRRRATPRPRRAAIRKGGWRSRATAIVSAEEVAIVRRALPTFRSEEFMAATRFEVLGIGNAIVDVIARTDDDFLAKQKMRKGTMQLIDEAQAAGIYDAMGPAVEVSGGSAANTIGGVASLGA